MSKLTKLNKKSANAIDLVTKTIKSLSEVNNEIDTEVERIELERKRLIEEKESLFATKNSNKRIINNFEGLLK